MEDTKRGRGCVHPQAERIGIRRGAWLDGQAPLLMPSILDRNQDRIRWLRLQFIRTCGIMAVRRQLRKYVRKGGDMLADKDATEKRLEDYADVFSDLVNVLLFKGNG